ncbi:MAG: FkbM family methyltransferase [Nostocoides sp.]
MTTGDHRRWLSAPFRPRNYRAVTGTFATYPRPVEALRRYVWGSGDYPWTTSVRTPLGRAPVLIPHPHDVRTVNEVFCRHDYGTGSPRVVVDVGANIGLSALYFLTRRPDSVVHCWEPLESNLAVLNTNVSVAADRCRIHRAALAPTAGVAAFLAEPIGRYSGLADSTGRSAQHVEIDVVCDGVEEALAQVLDEHGRIDLLKIDTEGSEAALVAAIPKRFLPNIGTIVYERPGGVVHTCGARLRAQDQ